MAELAALRLGSSQCRGLRGLGGLALPAALWLLAAWAGQAAASGQPSCGCPVGNVSDCCCTYADLEEANGRLVHDLLQRTVASPFFAHFKVNLCSECGLWQDSSLCVLRSCSVCECDDPPAWAKGDDCGGQQVDQGVVAGTSPLIAAGWPLAKPALEGGASADGEEVVVDLRLNPERYTGYDGSSAAKVWDAVHSSNCFQAPQQAEGEEVCLLAREQRVYNRLLSGLHSSISLHIAQKYCLERSTTTVGDCARWGPAPAVAYERVLRHPDRLENLYATFAVLLRAVVKAGAAVSAAVPKDAPEFAQELRDWEATVFPEIQRLAVACPKTFAEDELFAGPGAETLWEQVQGRLSHLAEIMKCVGCDRCKLWGTLQTQGISVALRVLFQPGAAEELTRQEAVALVHTLERLSSSLAYVREFRSQVAVQL